MAPTRRATALLLILAALVASSSCSADPPAARDTATAYLSALARLDTAGAAAETDSAEAARAVLDDAVGALEPESVTTELRQVQESGDAATAVFDTTWTLAEDRNLTYTGELPLTRIEDRWQIRWSPAVLHPELGANQTLETRTEAAPTAAVLDRGGDQVLTPSSLVRVTLDPASADDLPAVAAALATALNPLDRSITRESILAGVAEAPTQPRLVARLRDTDYQVVKPAIYELPGVSFPLEAALLTPDRTFAPTLLSQVRERVTDELEGRAGWKVVALNAAGGEVSVLAEGAPEPAPAVSLTLDTRVQRSAQDAVNAVSGLQAMVVALEPSTGAILAVAQNPEADAEGPVALTGLYPPGSTFKIATASAALQAGVSAPDAEVACPATTVIESRRIPNYEEFDLGTVPLRTAFARSCNTTFAELATELEPAGLTDAARQLGVGVDYAVDAITTVTGRVSPAPDTVLRAEDGIGQGEVVVSPFGMALVAASVANGSTPVPTLLAGTDTGVTDAGPPIPAPVVEGIRTLMRAVVTEGTATDLQGSGEVFGKTGEAQFGDGSRSHAWFVGYRGDLAFATLIVEGGSSRSAVALTGEFLAALDRR